MFEWIVLISPKDANAGAFDEGIQGIARVCEGLRGFARVSEGRAANRKTVVKRGYNCQDIEQIVTIFQELTRNFKS